MRTRLVRIATIIRVTGIKEKTKPKEQEEALSQRLFVLKFEKVKKINCEKCRSLSDRIFLILFIL